MKKIFIIVGAVILAAAIAAGSFYGGMAYNRNQQNQVRTAFLRSRGINPNDQGAFFNGQAPSGQNTNGGARGFFGGGMVGQIKSIEGNTLTISTAQNVITVTVPDGTPIEKTVAGALADLQVGERISVAGQRDTNGNITTVQQITILPPTIAQPQPTQGATP